jgi:serine phosphatase RsbU (regulator of sigma subunit)
LRSNLAGLLKAEQAARLAAEHAEKWLAPLRAAAAKALTRPSLDTVLGEALRMIAANLEADEASVLLAAPDGSELDVRAAVGLTVEVDSELHIPAGAGFAGRIFTSGKPLIVNELESFEVVSPVLRESGLNSIVGVPLLSGEKTIGVMHAGSKQPGRFSDEDVAILEVLAEPIAAAVGRVLLFEEERALREEAEANVRRLQALQRVTAALAAAGSVDSVCQATADHVLAGLGAGPSLALVALCHDERIVQTYLAADSRRRPEAAILAPLGRSSGGEAVYAVSPDEVAGRWPELAAVGGASFALVPFRVGRDGGGVLAVVEDVSHTFDAGERSYLGAVTEQLSLALDRTLAAERAAELQERWGFVTEVTLRLEGRRYSSAEEMLSFLAETVVGRFADFCSVALQKDGRLEEVTIARAGKSGRPGRSEAASPPRDHLGLAIRAFRSGEAAVAAPAGGANGSGGGPPSVPVRGANFAAIAVPIESRGDITAVVTFVAGGSRPPYGPEDVEASRALASRAGLLAEDIAERERDRYLGAVLSRALLPSQLPSVPGVRFVARYLPAAEGPVGGDWYDVLEMPERKLGLVVGDVGGHGVEAASTMAKLRNGLYAFASQGDDLPSILQGLTALLAGDSSGFNVAEPITTILFASLELDSRVLEITCAGHLPWLLLRGGVATAQECGGRVLTASLPALTAQHEVKLLPGDRCIFYTDGLIERPEEELSVSLERLKAATEEVAAVELEAFSDRLVEATLPQSGRRDDSCILVMQIDA